MQQTKRAAMAKNSLAKTLCKRLALVLVNAFATVAGVLKLFNLTLRQLSWLLFISGLGFLLLFLRQTFFDVAPSIATSADAWAAGVVRFRPGMVGGGEKVLALTPRPDSHFRIR